MPDIEALIRERAYLIWEESGKPAGRDKDHWFQAAKEILNGSADDFLNGSADDSLTISVIESAPTLAPESTVPVSSAISAPPLAASKAAKPAKRTPVRKK